MKNSDRKQLTYTQIEMIVLSRYVLHENRNYKIKKLLYDMHQFSLIFTHEYTDFIVILSFFYHLR